MLAQTSCIQPTKASSANKEFCSDMVDLFAGLRSGHIARHGYAGVGGAYYAQWLAQHTIYHATITANEIELINSSLFALADLCEDVEDFIEAGFGSVNAFQLKTSPLINEIAKRRGFPPHYIVADISPETFGQVRRAAGFFGMPLSTGFIHGNFFDNLPLMRKKSAIYCMGLTFTNIPTDAINQSTFKILSDTLRFFRRALSQGGVLIFSYASDVDGDAVRCLYEHPLIYAYQHSIFKRVATELPVSIDYDPYAFGTTMRHIWHPDNHVLTRHVTVTRATRFHLDGYEFLLPQGRDLYIANNFRFPDQLVEKAAAYAGFAKSCIFRHENSSLRIGAFTA